MKYFEKPTGGFSPQKTRNESLLLWSRGGKMDALFIIQRRHNSFLLLLCSQAKISRIGFLQDSSLLSTSAAKTQQNIILQFQSVVFKSSGGKKWMLVWHTSWDIEIDLIFNPVPKSIWQSLGLWPFTVETDMNICQTGLALRLLWTALLTWIFIFGEQQKGTDKGMFLLGEELAKFKLYSSRSEECRRHHSKCMYILY